MIGRLSCTTKYFLMFCIANLYLFGGYLVSSIRDGRVRPIVLYHCMVERKKTKITIELEDFSYNPNKMKPDIRL